MTEGFGPKIDGFDHFNFGDHKGLRKAIKKTPAIMVGNYGEGGIKLFRVLFERIRKICNKKKFVNFR